MPRLFCCVILCVSGFACGDDALTALQTQCARKQSSLLKERNGTPSCDQLNRISHQSGIPADSPQEIDRLLTQCKREQSSLLKESNGTPSCDQLDRIYHYPSAPQSAAAPQTTTPPQLEYYWTNGKYCGHDATGNAVHCY